MKIIIPIILMILFVSSFFMPAYFGYPGWYASYICFRITPYIFQGEWGSIYYALFNVTNFLALYFFIFLIFDLKKWQRSIKWIGGLLCIHLLSWPILNMYPKIEGITIIGIGYYAWTGSIIIGWALYVKKGRDLQAATPTPVVET